MSWGLPPIAARVERLGWPALWLPLVLLWPLIVALFGLALPLAVLVPAPRRAVFAVLVACVRMLCAMHGSQLTLSSAEHGTWNISLY